MEKGAKKTLLFIIAIIIFIVLVYLLTRPKPVTDEEIVKCIGSKSEIYTLPTCVSCRKQKLMFGNNEKYLNIIDCNTDKEKCLEKDILKVPTWIINGEKYIGVQSIDRLKELTGC